MPHSVATLRVIVLISAAWCALGCTQRHKTRPAGELSRVGSQARVRYLAGMEELLGNNYAEAVQQFQQVVKNPGYVKYAALARLRIGDALLLQEKYAEAIDVFQSFLKQFEGNPNSGYARFRIGHAYYEQIPSGWFLAPPVHEREQIHVRRAARALRHFVEFYPGHPLVLQARTMLDRCENLLYEHEAYLVAFYHKRQKPRAVILRLVGMFKEFPERAATEENFLELGRAYVTIGDARRATLMYQAYLERFPKGKYIDQARKSLRVLRSVEPHKS